MGCNVERGLVVNRRHILSDILHAEISAAEKSTQRHDCFYLRLALFIAATPSCQVQVMTKGHDY